MIGRRNQDITGLDTRVLSRTVCRDPPRFQSAMRLHPPDAVRGLLELGILDQVERSKDGRGERKQRQRYHGKPG